MKKHLALLLLIPGIILSGCAQEPTPTEAPVETENSTLVTHYPGQSVECDTDLEHEVTWTLEDGVLTYSGRGDIWDDESVEWYSDPTAIREIVFEEGIECICTDIFSGLPNLTKVTVAETVGTLCSFNDCPSLVEVNLENQKIIIGGFSGCTALTELVLPEAEDRIESYTYEGCTSLKDITIPGRIKSIDTGAFQDCTGLEKVTIEEGVECIMEYSFANCTSLKEVYIPASVVIIEQFVFENCPELTKIEVHPDNPWITVNENNEIVYK